MKSKLEVEEEDFCPGDAEYQMGQDVIENYQITNGQRGNRVRKRVKKSKRNNRGVKKQQNYGQETSLNFDVSFLQKMNNLAQNSGEGTNNQSLNETNTANIIQTLAALASRAGSQNNLTNEIPQRKQGTKKAIQKISRAPVYARKPAPRRRVPPKQVEKEKKLRI